MDLQEYLRQFVSKQIWCSPHQDHQAILKLARLTKFGGTWHSFDIGWTSLNLPEDDAPFHVYQIGQNCPIDLGLFPQRGLWIKLSDLCTTQSMIVDVYLNNGVQIPRTQSWICRTHDKNYVLCVKEVLRISDLNHEDLNIRFYTDAYFGSPRGQNVKNTLKCNGGLMTSPEDIVALQTEVMDISQKVGYVSLYHNGRYVNNISGVYVQVGDYVEYLYDPAIAAVIDFPLSGLPTYLSSLDKLSKYLIHPPKRGDSEIYYRDDVDIFLIKKEPGNYINGIYYHRNAEPSMRMVTHRDYSIPTAFVQGYVKDDARWQTNSQGLIVRLHIRESGYKRPLVMEHHRIHEIYKMTDTKILRAMQGLDGVLEEWKADALESSHYPYLMSCWYPEITGVKAICALGYNSISQIVANTPSKVIHTAEGFNYVELPWGLQTNSTMYEYDKDGLLLGFYVHRSGTRYYTENKTCELVEGICGVATQQIDVWFGKVPLVLDPNQSYRFYISDLRSGATANNWREVKVEDGLFTFVNGKFNWLYDESRQVGVVKGDSKFLGYKLQLKQDDGFFRFHLNYTDVQGVIMEVPVGKVELWLEGRSLIEGIDFYINWPECVIVNKEWLNVDGVNSVVVRCTDWCEPDGTMRPPEEVGFVQHGMLSVDNIYNVRDDRVIRCIADGRTFHRDDLLFAEQKYGLRLKNASGVNDGRPYLISPVRVPLPGYTPYDSDSLRERSEIVDKKVGDYLGKQLTPPVFDTPVMITWRYRVYSPLISKLIFDMQKGWFKEPSMPSSDKTILDSLVDYIYILEYEPARKDPNLEYVTIHPHPWAKTRTVTQNQYAFLTRVISLYLSDRVDLTQFVTIKG